MFFTDFHKTQMSLNKTWINSHFGEAAGELQRLFLNSGFDLKGKHLLDIGSGDGLIAAGLVAKSESRVTGLDLIETDKFSLLEHVPRKYRKLITTNLHFEKATGNTWPFPDAHFDGIYSWSAAEHFHDSVGVYSEVRRVLAPEGIFVLQTYPLWNSRWGHHLETWLPEYFHLNKSEEEIRDALLNLTESRVPVQLSKIKSTKDLNEILLAKSLTKPEWVQHCMNTYRSTNKIEASEIIESLHTSGFEVRRLEIISLPSILPAMRGHENILNFGIEGLKLVCVPLREKQQC